jgi:hypothetical protein
VQYHVGDKVRIKDTCRIDSLRAGDIVTIDWVGVDLNNIVLYTVREDPTGNLLDEYDIEPYNIGWVCPRCGAVNAPWVRMCYCQRGDIDLGHDTFCDHDWEYIRDTGGGFHWVCRKCGAQSFTPYEVR